MRCPICEIGILKKGYTEYSELGISFGKYPAEICTHCSEAFFDEKTSKKLEEKSKKLGLFGIAKRIKVGASRSDLTIRIPKKIAKFVNLGKGMNVIISPRNKNKIEIEILSKK